MRKGIILLMIISCLGLGGFTVFLRLTEDNKAPEIHFQENEITYMQGSDYEELLLGVTATDDKDGDVTESLVVESVYPNDDGETAPIVYAARDSKNNIGKANKIVKYQVSDGTESEKQATGNTGKETTSPEPTQAAQAAATNQGQEMITLSGDNEDSASGDGDEQEDTEEDLSEESPRIKLKSSQVTISKGESVNRISFVESITDDEDSRESLWRNIQITGDALDVNTSGTYELIYYVNDSDGNKSNEAKLTVTVR